MTDITIGLKLNYDGSEVTVGTAKNRDDLQSLAQSAQTSSATASASSKTLGEAEAQTTARIKEALATSTEQAAAQNSLAVQTTAAAAAVNAFGETEAQAAARIKAMVAASIEQTEAQNALNRTLVTGAQGLAGAGQTSQTTQGQIERLNTAQQSNVRWFNETSKSAREQSLALAETSANTGKLIDKYNPLSTKLKSLQADFAELDKAASSGAISAADFDLVDAAYEKIRAGIKATEAAMAAASGNVTAGFEQITDGATESGGMTQAVTQDLITLGREAITGNFGQMPGTFLRLAQSVGMSGVAFGALVGVIGGAAGAVGVYALAIHQVSEEQRAMDRALALTNNFSAQTQSGMLSLADSVAAGGKVTIATSKDIVTQLAASGKIGAGAFADVARLTADYAHLSGQSADSVAKDMIRLFADPSAGAKELDGTLGGLSIAELERIDHLTRTGQVVEAQTLLVAAYQKALEANKTELMDQIPWYEKWGNAVSNAWSKATKAMTPAHLLSTGEQIAELYEKIAIYKFNRPTALGPVPEDDEGLVSLQKKLRALEDIARAEKNTTALKAEADKKDAYEKGTAAIVYQNSALLAREKIIEQIKRLETSPLPAGTDAEQYRPGALNSLQDKLVSPASLTTVAKLQYDFGASLRDGAIKDNLAALDGMYKTGLIYQSDYIRKKVALEKDAAQSTIERIQNEIRLAELSARHIIPGSTEEAQKTAELIGLKTRLSEAKRVLANVGTKEEIDAQVEENRQLQVNFDALEAMAKPFEDNARSLELQVQNYGLSNEQIALNSVAMLDGARAAEILNGALESQVAPLERQIAALKRTADAYRMLSIRKTEAEQQAAVDKKEEALTSAMGTADDYATTLKGRNRLLESQIALYSRATISINDESTAQRILNAQTKVQVELEEKLRALYKQGLSETSQEAERIRALAAEEKLKIASMETAKATHAEWQKGFELTNQAAFAAFDGMGKKGENVAKKIGNTLETALRGAVYKAGMEPLVLKAYTVGAGMLGLSPGGTAGNGLGMANNAYNLYNTGSSIATGTSTALNAGATALGAQSSLYGMYGAGSSQAAMLASQTAAFGTAGTTATTTALASNTAAVGSLTSTLGAIPVWGWAALAAVAAYSIFGSKGGGPKEGGFATTSTNGVADFNRTYTPNTADTGLQTTVAGAQSVYAATAARFGVYAPAKFSLGYDTDPKGTASNRYTYDMQVNGQHYGARDVADGRGDAAATATKALNAMMLEAFQHTDFGDTLKGKLAAAVVAGLKPEEITTQLAAKVETALAGAATLFDSSSPLDVAINVAKASAAALSEQFVTAGVSGGGTAAGLKTAVLALDTTTAAGQESARSMLALVPALKTYESQLLGMVGLTADSISKNLFDAIKNPADAASAGAAFEAAVMGGINDSLLGGMSTRVGSMMTSGIMSPILDSIINGSVTALIASGALDTAVEEIEQYVANFETAISNPEIQAALERLATSIGKVGTAAAGVHINVPGAETPQPPQQPAYTPPSYSAPATTVADTAKKRRELEIQLMEASGNAAGALAAKRQDEIAALNLLSPALGALQSQINEATDAGKLAVARHALDIQIMELSGDSAGALSAKRKDELDAMDASLRPLQERINALTDEKTAAAALLDTQKTLATGQIDLIQRLQSTGDGIRGLMSRLDGDILGMDRLNPSFDAVGYYTSQIDILATKYTQLATATDANAPDSLQSQIDLGGQIRDRVMSRYDAELAAIKKATDATTAQAKAAVDLRQVVDKLKTGDLSPLTNAQRLAEAEQQYRSVLTRARGGDLDAKGQLGGSFQDYLKLAQGFYASSTPYTDIYNQGVADISALAEPAKSTEQLLADIKGGSDAYNTAALSLARDTKTVLQGMKDVTGTRLATVDESVKKLAAGLVTYLGDNSPLLTVIGGLPDKIANLVGRPDLVKTAPSVTMGNTAVPSGATFSAAEIKSVVTGLTGGGYTQAQGISNVYGWASYRGVTATQIANAYGVPVAQVNSMTDGAGLKRLPQFRDGGTASSGYYIAHEGELIEGLGATRIFPADQTSHLLERLSGGQDNTALIAKVQVLIEKVEELTADNARLAEMVANAVYRSGEGAAEMVVAAVEKSANVRQPRAGFVKQ